MRWPSLFFGIAVAALVLGLAIGSRPMFVSSAASGALAADLDDGCRFNVGLRIQRIVTLADLPLATAAVDDAVGASGVRRDVERVTTLFGENARVLTADGARGVDRVQLVARSGFEDHIEVLERGPRAGIWLPDTVTQSLGIVAGDSVELAAGGDPVPVEVGGVFRDLSRRRDGHWCSLDPRIDEFQGLQPPPVALLDEEALVSVLAASRLDRAETWWEYAPGGSGWTLDRAGDVIGALTDVAAASNNDAAELATTIGRGRSAADLAGSIRHAERTSVGVDGAAGPVALGTAGVAVLVLLTAGRSWLDRRRQEVTILAMRGAGPGWLALKAVLELSVPLVVGAVVGVASAWALVRAVGPSELVERTAIRDGIVQVAAVLGVAVIALAAAVGAAVRRVGVTTGGIASRATLLWWEPPVLALAAAALYELRSGSGPVDEYAVDGLLLVFPVLLLAGGAGLGARLALTPRVSGWLAAHLPVAGWLAARRLGASRLRASAIVTGTAVAIGIVAFAGSMSSSLRTTTEAKVLLGPGAEQVIRLVDAEDLPDGVGDDGASTLVIRATEVGVERRGHPSSDVLGVDPDTFADAAYWDPSFAGASLDELLAHLDAGAADDPVPVIAVGDELPDRFVLALDADSGPVAIEVAVAARADAFPGLGFRVSRPLVVIDREALAARGVDGLDEVWVAGRSSAVVDRLVATGNDPVFVTMAQTGVVESRLRAQLWAVDYLEIVGPAAAVVTLAGLALYLAATSRQRRIGTAMAAQMGLRSSTRVVATGVEISAMTLAGWFLGVVLSWVAARLVLPELDPLPSAAPDAIFRYGGSVVAVAAALALGAALVATALVEARSHRHELPELLRDGR